MQTNFCSKHSSRFEVLTVFTLKSIIYINKIKFWLKLKCEYLKKNKLKLIRTDVFLNIERSSAKIFT